VLGDGITPLEVMLQDMRYWHVLWRDAIERDSFSREAQRYSTMAMKAAVKAAPYVHPRKRSVTVESQQPLVVNVVQYSDLKEEPEDWEPRVIEGRKSVA